MELDYKKEVSGYGRKDGITVLCVWLGYTILSTVFASVRSMLSLSWISSGIVNIIFCILMAAGVFIILHLNKNSIMSIGLHKMKLGQTIRLGLLVSLIPIIIFIIIAGIINGFNEVDAIGLLFVLITTFCFAAHEDIIFVGFIQTRLYGFFKTQKVAILVSALLFAFMHVPLWIITGRFDFSQPMLIIQSFSAWLILHVIMVAIFKRHFSIIPVFIFHTLWNFSFTFAQPGTIEFSWIGLALAALTACILLWRSYKNEE